MARHWTRLLLVTLLAGGSTNCLFDTGPINKPPTVQVDELNQSLYREAVTFTATIDDPDQSTDSLNVTWHVDTDCGKAASSAPLSCATQSKDTCSYTPKALGPICVVVQVTDRYGAKATASRSFSVEDQRPTAVISPISLASIDNPLPLSTNLTFSAAKSSDPDPNDALTYEWTVTQPDRNILSATSCPAPQTPDTCSFTASMPGTYQVQLIARDSSQMKSDPVSVSIVINDDQPPCIDINGLQPKALQTIIFSAQDNIFSVGHVSDDLDPYPPISGSAFYGTFSWFYQDQASGGFKRLQNTYNSNQLSFNANNFASDIGYVIQVRVEYQDRRKRDLSVSCDQTAPRCELVPGSGCAQWVTWAVTVLP